MHRLIKVFLLYQVIFLYIYKAIDNSKIQKELNDIEKFYSEYSHINWCYDKSIQLYLKNIFVDTDKLYLEKLNKYYRIEFNYNSIQLQDIVTCFFVLYNIKYGVTRWKNFSIIKNSQNSYTFSGVFFWYLLN